MTFDLSNDESANIKSPASILLLWKYFCRSVFGPSFDVSLLSVIITDQYVPFIPAFTPLA